MTNAKITGEKIVDGIVKPEWIDSNDHMNVAYYVLAFDLAVDALWARIGITDEYIRERVGSTFAVDCRVTYQRELREGDPYCIATQILAYDEKRIHQFQRMYHAREGSLAATAEWMNLHVDLSTRRVAPWPDSVLRSLAAMTRRQRRGSYPEEVGKRLTVEKPLYTLAET